MRKPRVWSATFVHPEYGVCLVWFTWKRDGPGYAAVPIGVEFDLFTPESERALMLEELGMSPGQQEDHQGN